MAARLPDRRPIGARSPVPATAARPLARGVLPARRLPPAPPKPETSKRNWALYLFLFLLPLQNIQTGYLPNGGAGFNFLNIGFVLSLIGAWIVGGRLAPRESVNGWVVAYLGYSVFALLLGYTNVSEGTDEHFNVLKDHAIAVLLVYIVQMSVKDVAGVKRILIATLLPMPYILRVTLAEHDSVSRWHYSDALRIQGTFSLLGANEFAAFCVTVSVTMLGLLLATRMSNKWRALIVVAIACMVTGVIYAYSRTAYIALMLGALAVAFAWRGRWKMLVPVLLLSVILPTVLPESVTERFNSTTLEEGKRDESTELRFEFWQVAWTNFAEHPIFGSGFHTFHHKEINPYGKDTHNFFMRTLTEEGIVGGAIVLGLLLSLFGAARRAMRTPDHQSWAYGLGLGVLGAWVALICSNCFGDRFTYYPMIGYFWVYVGLAAKARAILAHDQALQQERERANAASTEVAVG
jgi:putative inorganic carbon (HCO3(-)) transporter